MSCKQSLSKAEMTSQQLESMSQTRETDINAAIKARDEAVKDARTLALRVESLEEALQILVRKSFSSSNSGI